jgi:hypothetical protein
MEGVQARLSLSLTQGICIVKNTILTEDKRVY